MSSYVKEISDRLDFIEFKQNILLLKQPQHKASIFYDLTLDDFLKIKSLTAKVSDIMTRGEKYTIYDFEKELFVIWPPIKSYPSSSTLVAKALMDTQYFDQLFMHDN
ncbi:MULTISPECIES: hypothetical protein [Romboutsia]|uniref:Uncharacterized protein n=1 Tax=Romboutsia hominis TaxID=1507512 RepID=A0A2P2BUA1_9FIRM|nr:MULTISPECIES: hypothetical protein [Romboutsia]MDB8789605.1 hypothetical protein [Romboutsia sp. 1001216sp1]MDB8793789.1 hypothetical protein [Romboutsia sp. 1001216sp1]MDB8797541.1 hypothetical protein [Romboutsia sp. 1001216sp1]MDB8799957.1 hypothetical protein [Romboutsia sp. 1001216sp1]MDB8802758.1 hypothetical protein [Romboutsia sp. 1001216sp1]